MTNFPRFFAFLLFVVMLVFMSVPPTRATEKPRMASAEALLADFEGTSGGRLGVYARNMADGAEVSYRADERFPLCSTFKVILTAAILERSAHVADLMGRRITYTRNDLAFYSPVTEKHLDHGMTVAQLCSAAMQYSDNTAANILMKILGGPSAVTTFARSIGNKDFRLDRWETDLNTAIPGDPRDTATPASMAHSLQALALGHALSAANQKQLVEWLRGNTTGAKRIRAVVPDDWRVGDKTGSGPYGITNDIAVLWPPEGEPIVLAIYYTRKDAEAKCRNEVVAEAARIVLKGFGKVR